MSSSRPETAIFLTDSTKVMRKKVMDAFTGGQPTAKEQRKKGGNPDKCVVYGLYVYHLMPDDEELLELREACKSGELICGDCKARAIELMGKFLGEQQERRERARSQVEKYVEE